MDLPRTRRTSSPVCHSGGVSGEPRRLSVSLALLFLWMFYRPRILAAPLAGRCVRVRTLLIAIATASCAQNVADRPTDERGAEVGELLHDDAAGGQESCVGVGLDCRDGEILGLDHRAAAPDRAHPVPALAAGALPRGRARKHRAGARRSSLRGPRTPPGAPGALISACAPCPPASKKKYMPPSRTNGGKWPRKRDGRNRTAPR